MNLDAIRDEVQRGRLFFTRHAIQRMGQRGITPEDVEVTILHGEIIEEYPDDKYGPSCLIAAKLAVGWIHVVVTMKRPLWLITAYFPDPKEWKDFKKRIP